ncbi:hypothetical protein [Stutzerimonas nitrititolerans]|uniref:hypothetical protein n=1 Tax=Stutzerimonas nitrititolerans TaxID=2482751 RepID=UPI00289E0337|nr:hypothetical protein [Stutzerimonas nitrititolerans]
MMKKTFAALLVASTSFASGLVYAADNTVSQVQGGVYVENDATGCSILRDRVTVNLSTNVTMAYNCMTATNKVNLAACHSAGSQKPTNVPCTSVGEDEDGDPIYNGSNCTAAGVAATPPMQTEIQGRRAFIASTTGGSVGTASLNSATCDMAALGGLSSISQ